VRYTYSIFGWYLRGTVTRACGVSWCVSYGEILTFHFIKIRERIRNKFEKWAKCNYHVAHDVRMIQRAGTVVPLSAHIWLLLNLFTSVGQNDGRWLVEPQDSYNWEYKYRSLKQE
jgi:hypothetical protein